MHFHVEVVEQRTRETRRSAAIALFVIGILLVAIAAFTYAGAPAELPLSAPGWWDSVSAHHTALMIALVCGGLGVAAIVAAVGLTGPVYRLGLDLRSEAAAATARGVLDELDHDATRLQALRDRGVIDAAEYEALRVRIGRGVTRGGA
jgi:hypothetical protein